MIKEICLFIFIITCFGNLNADTLTIRCDNLGEVWKPNFTFREYEDSIYLYERWNYTLHVMNNAYKCKRHFKTYRIDKDPLYAHDFIVYKDGFLFVKDLALHILYFNGKRTAIFGLTKRYNGFIYQKLYFNNQMMFYNNNQIYFLTNIFKEKIDLYEAFLSNKMYERGIFTAYSIPNLFYPDSLIFIDPAIELGEKGSIYRQKNVYFPHIDDRNFYVDDHKNIHISEEANHLIKVINIKGEIIKEFGIDGKYYIEPEFWEYSKYNSRKDFLVEYKIKRNNSYKYKELFYDDPEQMHYRVYVSDVDQNKKFLQVYKNEKLIDDFEINADIVLVKAKNKMLYYYLKPEKINKSFQIIIEPYESLKINN